MADKQSAPATPPPAAPAAAGAPGASTVPGAPAAGAPVPPRRSPGHRGQDVRDTVAEMTAKAQEISLEAGSKMAAAMKDVIGAAAGLTGFVAESARDLVQYMVRRGQMTQEEADRLIKEAEEHQGKRRPVAQRSTAAPGRSAAAGRSTSAAKPHAGSSARPPARKAPASKAPASRAAAKKAPAKKGPARKAPAKKAPAKKAAAKKPAPKAGARSKPAKKAARR